MTIEKLTEDERRAACGTLLEKAVRIIDAHEVDRAALVAESDALHVQCDKEHAAWVVERRMRKAAETESAALRAELAEARAEVDEGLNFAAETGLEIGSLRQELELAKRIGGGFSSALMAAEAQLAEARALLETADSPSREWTHRYLRWSDANPVSPRASVYHMFGCDARDGLPCTHDCENHRYGESPRADAERAVLDACSKLTDVSGDGYGPTVGETDAVYAAEAARRAVKP